MQWLQSVDAALHDGSWDTHDNVPSSSAVDGSNSIEVDSDVEPDDDTESNSQEQVIEEPTSVAIESNLHDQVVEEPASGAIAADPVVARRTQKRQRVSITGLESTSANCDDEGTNFQLPKRVTQRGRPAQTRAHTFRAKVTALQKKKQFTATASDMTYYNF